MSAGTTTHESRKLLRGVSWQDYVALRDNDEYRNTRMTFDRGSLELMSPTKLHERVGYLIGRCIDVWTEERRIAVQSCRSTTFRRNDLLRGLEPDNCYYIEHEPAVRDRDDLDLSIDPPPDLAIEVDVTAQSIDRMAIYAALGVTELWRWHDDALNILRLNAKREYSEVSASQALTGFPCERLVELVKRRTSTDETTLIREFRAACQATRP
jgi:Uma2 family endonuclease